MSTASSSLPALPRRLLKTLRRLPQPRGYLVALSGGLDSTVLLHLMTRLHGELKAPLRAIHVHHGLQAEADDWSLHCKSLCDQLSLPLVVRRVEVESGRRQSLEAQARRARYRAIADAMGEGEMVLLAHHGDDQAETLLLQLLRGAGVAGLAAMPLVRPWHGGWLARPLLEETRESLRGWAEKENLAWLEDPSNQDRRHARNYLRHEVMPLLRRRWPNLAATLGRSARHCGQAGGLLAELAESDLEKTVTSNPWQLRLPPLAQLTPVRRANLLRYWMAAQGVTTPPEVVLARVEKELMSARRDAVPEICWKGGALRRFRERLFLFPEPLPRAPDVVRLDWSGRTALPLPEGLGRLELAGEPPSWFLERRVEVGFRQTGLRCRPAGRAGSRRFKQLCQELGIPPWLRSRLPLVWVDGELTAVGDYSLCHPFAGEMPFRWQRPDWLR